MFCVKYTYDKKNQLFVTNVFDMKKCIYKYESQSVEFAFNDFLIFFML